MTTQTEQFESSRRRVESRRFETAFSAVGVLAGEDDTALVAAAQSGRSEAFEILVRRHQAKSLRLASRFTLSHEDSEDIAQQAFQKAFVHLRRFEGNSSFSTWLTRITINEGLMWLRKKRSSPEVRLEKPSFENETVLIDPPDSAPNPEETCLQLERKRIVSAALNKLTPTMRTAIELRELAELSVKETAGIMGLSIGTVKARLFRGRGKLREKLKNYVGLAGSGAARFHADTGVFAQSAKQ